MRAAELAARLPSVKRHGAYYMCCCPVHEDHEPSLSFSDGEKGIVFKCFAGCPQKEVMMALAAVIHGQVADFFFEPRQRRNGQRPEILSVFPYHTHEGEIVYQVCKYADGTFKVRRPHPERDGWISNMQGVTPVLYNLPELLGAKLVCYTEGERDAESLRTLGLVATTNPFGAKSFHLSNYAHQMQQAMDPTGWVVVFRDEDEPGIALQQQVLVAGHAAGIKMKQIILPDLPPIPGADISDWLAGGHTKAELLALIEATGEWEPAMSADIEVEPPVAEQRKEKQTEPYTFQAAFGPEHFVSQYIDLVSIRTDAAHEYAEAAALLLLAVATPGVRAQLTIFPSGLGTNLYILVLGVSTRSRKSTVMRATTDLLARSDLARALLPDKMSPEAFVEQMARRDGIGALWGVDEFGPMLGKFHHAAYMEDFAGNLLTAYDAKEIYQARRSKRNKDTGHHDRDEDRARQPHLNIYALSTPALLFKKLVLEDIAGGLLPRFAILFPLTKPRRRDIARVEADLEGRERAIITRLNRIAEWSANGGQVEIDDSALAGLNAYDRAQEDRQAARDHDDVASLMFERHVGMLAKVAILSAIGRSDLLAPVVPVASADVGVAQIVLDRWATFATTFVGQLGASEHEGYINRASVLVEKYGARARRDLSRSLKLSKRQLDEIEATMRDRGLIRVEGSTWQWQAENT